MSSGAQIHDYSPPDAAVENGIGCVVTEEWGSLALQALRRLQRTAAAPEPTDALPDVIETALYAWAVSCYEQNELDEMTIVLDELIRLNPSSDRLRRAVAANCLARGVFAKSADLYRALVAQTPADLELKFNWAQSEFGRGNIGLARRLVDGIFMELDRLVVPQASLRAFCDELLTAMTDL